MFQIHRLKAGKPGKTETIHELKWKIIQLLNQMLLFENALLDEVDVFLRQVREVGSEAGSFSPLAF